MQPGLRYLPANLDRSAQQELVDHLRAAVAEAPLFTPIMPRTGRPFTVRMTNLGTFGWVSDRAGYRYQPTHPETGQPWPPIPDMVLDIWRKLSGSCVAPASAIRPANSRRISFIPPGLRLSFGHNRAA